MNSLSFLRQMLQDVRHQKVRTLLTLFGITWGTVSVALLVSFGEGLEARIRKNQRGHGREHRDRLAGGHLPALRGPREGPEDPGLRGRPRGPAPGDQGRDVLRGVPEGRQPLPARAGEDQPGHVRRQLRVRGHAEPHPGRGRPLRQRPRPRPAPARGLPGRQAQAGPLRRGGGGGPDGHGRQRPLPGGGGPPEEGPGLELQRAGLGTRPSSPTPRSRGSSARAT